MKEEKLTLKTKLGYGICDLGGNLFFTAIAFWLTNFLTDSVGLAAWLVGIALLTGKIWDAITDPVVGFLSDYTKTRWGRRRPYMFVGSFALFIGMIIMFTNPKVSSQGILFVWATISYVFLCTAYTIVNIPYSSLTPELTTNFNERTSLSGYRMSFAVIGTLIAAVAFLPIVGMFNNKDTGHTMVGIIFGAIMMITALITVFAIREKPINVSKPAASDLIKSYFSTFKNRPFLLILFPWAFHITGVTILSGSFIYYYKYIYSASEMQINIALLTLLLTSMLFIPIWVLISKKLGKKLCYNLGMLLVGATIVAFALFGHKVLVNFSYIFMFVSGIGLATNYVMPWAIIPDVIEYDYLNTGKRREGLFYGLWTFISKLGQALAALAIGLILTFFKYVPEVVQSAQAKIGIRFLIGPIPALFFIVGVIILHFYPINQEMYKKILAQIKEKESNGKLN